LTIDGVLDNGIYNLNVGGNYILNGTHSGTGDIHLDGVGIDGTGTITNSGILRIRGVDKVIQGSADITKAAGEVRILSDISVTNYGTITICGDIVGGNAGSEWENEVNSTLNIGGDLLIIGTLFASANCNTVHYLGATQNIKATPYCNLSISSPSACSNAIGNKIASFLTVSDTLTMNQGNIVVISGSLMLGTDTSNPGTLIYTSGAIIGKFKRWINSAGVGVLYPVGTLDTANPALITPTDLTPGSLIGEFVESVPGNNGLPLADGADTVFNTYTEGYWNFTESDGLASTDYDLELTGNGFFSMTINSSTRILKRTTSSAPWVFDGANVTAAGSTVKRTGLNGFSQFALGDTSKCLASFINITGTDISCSGANDGTAYITAAGVEPPYTYNWSNGDTVENISSLSPGAYSVTVTDANGCNETENIIISEPSSIVISSIADTATEGNNNGSIDITVAGGVPPLTYLWSNGEVTEDIDSISAGMYSVVVTDSNGCTDSADITVPQITGIDRPQSDAYQFKVFPNPHNGQFTITYSYKLPGRLTLKLYKASGQLLFEEGNSCITGNYTAKLDMSKYSKGIYWIQVISGQEVITRKVIYY